MKRSIIILLSLIVLWVVPVLASTPCQENAPMASQEDSLFLLDISQISEEELNKIIGNIVNSGTQPDIYQEAGTQGRDEMLIF
ncbi:MAG: hypothetical protein ACK4YF_05065 [Exilispira sp.]